MRLYRFIYVPIALCFWSSLSAQIIQGTTIDAKTNKALSYVSIGILHTNIGTVSAVDGKFKLSISNTNISTDTLIISDIGYSPIIIPLSYYIKYKNSNDSNFELEPKVELLNECIIGSGKTKRLISGNTVKNGVICVGFSSEELGTEIGTVIKYHKKKRGKVENVNFNIADNKYDSLLFRVNIYNFSSGKIGKSLLKSPIYLKIKTQKGIVSVDLSDSNIYVSKDFLLSLEWIKNYSPDDAAIDEQLPYGIDKLHFCAGFLNSNSYIRPGSESDWSKSPVGIGFWATIQYKKHL
ncbi:MAG TPA: carboxypeptidase-like regulatory domain-containing protein [Bacteroidia bacterium]|nr:carboxypeptidase-like regulatory domain-containing protein [Bacteroidia bacterium]